jgi:putative restriction endonuclease
MRRNPNWTRDELIVAFNLYCKIPFGRIHNRNPEIIALAAVLGRTPSALSYKLANFSRLDPSLRQRGISGAGHGSHAEEEIWAEFHGNWNSLAYESEVRRARLENKSIEETVSDTLDPLPEGMEREALVKTRVNQQFFRTAVLCAYENRCAISGLAVPELLNASHIVPWRVDIANRTNPRNGLCLNALLDRAFDRGLISFSPELRVVVSSRIRVLSDDDSVSTSVIRYHDSPLRLPRKFVPHEDFLAYHRKNVFIP